MKTIEEIIRSRPVYLNDWANQGKVGVVSDFEDIYMNKEEYEAKEPPYPNVDLWHENKDKLKRKLKGWKDIKILFASYGQANYSGEAWVLFTKDSKLYEVNAGHCSCYGLEGQWSPEEVVLPELKNRLVNGTWGKDDWSDNNFREELIKFFEGTMNKKQRREYRELTEEAKASILATGDAEPHIIDRLNKLENKNVLERSKLTRRATVQSTR